MGGNSKMWLKTSIKTEKTDFRTEVVEGWLSSTIGRNHTVILSE